MHQVLHEVLQVIPAKGAGIYLHDNTEVTYTLQCAENAPLLPETQNEIDHKQIKEVRRLEDDSIFDISFYPILSRDHSVQAIVCLAKDVTTIKETEQRIQQTEKLVAVGQLAAGVAHEINNPLGVILCHTDIIKENSEDDEVTLRDISIIERHTENCKRIVADLLDFFPVGHLLNGTAPDRSIVSSSRRY